jgi:hypothetical protein
MIRYDIWYDMIYNIFLTAIGLTPVGSSTVHTYTQYIEQHNRHLQYTEQHSSLIRKSAPSLRVVRWHLPYNWVKSTEKPSKKGVYLDGYVSFTSQLQILNDYFSKKLLEKFLFFARIFSESIKKRSFTDRRCEFHFFLPEQRNGIDSGLHRRRSEISLNIKRGYFSSKLWSIGPSSIFGNLMTGLKIVLRTLNDTLTTNNYFAIQHW